MWFSVSPRKPAMKQGMRLRSLGDSVPQKRCKQDFTERGRMRLGQTEKPGQAQRCADVSGFSKKWKHLWQLPVMASFCSKTSCRCRWKYLTSALLGLKQQPQAENAALLAPPGLTGVFFFPLFSSKDCSSKS